MDDMLGLTAPHEAHGFGRRIVTTPIHQWVVDRMFPSNVDSADVGLCRAIE
jgi:hypothetical protein